MSVDSNRLQMENPSAIYFGEIYSAPATETQLNPEGQPKTAEDTTTANLNDWTALRPRGLAIAHHAHAPFEPILDNASEERFILTMSVSVVICAVKRCH